MDEPGKFILGSAAVGLLAFMGYCTVTAVYDWVRPKGLSYVLNDDRVVFTSEHGIREWMLQSDARRRFQEHVLHAEVVKGTLKNEELYELCRSMDQDLDRIITAEEAKHFQSSQR